MAVGPVFLCAVALARFGVDGACIVGCVWVRAFRALERLCPAKREACDWCSPSDEGLEARRQVKELLGGSPITTGMIRLPMSIAGCVNC